MVLLVNKSREYKRKNCVKKQVILRRVKGGSIWSTIFEYGKKALPYILPTALPFVANWFMNRNKGSQQQGLPIDPSMLPSNLADVAALAGEKAKGMVPKEVLEMYEKMKEMSVKPKGKKPKVVVEEGDDEDEEVLGEGMYRHGKGVRRKLQKLIKGKGLFIH